MRTEASPAILPLAAVKLLQIEAFEDDTGQLTRKFSDAFGMSREERKKAQALLSSHLEVFAEAELSQAEIIEENEEGFIRLNPCHTEVAAASNAMRESLSEVLGAERGDAAFALLEKQLRDGGRNRLEISFTAIEGGSQWVLVRDLFDATGSRISHLEGPRLLNAEYKSLARWRHLSKLFERVTE